MSSKQTHTQNTSGQEKQTAQAENARICPFCHTTVRSASEAYCPVCGALLPNRFGYYPTRRHKRRRKEGCYIATCVYGSYDAAPVRISRQYRDEYLKPKWWGRLFVKLYYIISPTLVKMFGRRTCFINVCRKVLDKKVLKFNERKAREL